MDWQTADRCHELAILAALALADHLQRHGGARCARLRRLEDRWLLTSDRAGLSPAVVLDEGRARLEGMQRGLIPAGAQR